VVLDELLELGLQGLGDGGFLGCQIVGFPRVLGEVEELGSGAEDVFVIAVEEDSEFA